jgi:putative endopeptidase
MDDLVANLVAAYRESIEGLDWMTAATKRRALDKLAKFTPKIGYPARWRDYSALVIDAGDLVGNVRRSNAFDLDRELAKVGRPLDRDEWFMTPQTVNAYYNPGMNEIVFPAAILQPPFFDSEADDAVNYGGIGAVIGHEIGHGFDDQGSKYDGLVPRQLAPDGPHVNGALTVGENIGDLGGLSIAVKAYRIALGGPLAGAPVLDGMTGLERVFLGWAQAWQSKGRDEEVRRRIAIDPHSPDEFRCNAVVPARRTGR